MRDVGVRQSATYKFLNSRFVSTNSKNGWHTRPIFLALNSDGAGYTAPIPPPSGESRMRACFASLLLAMPAFAQVPLGASAAWPVDEVTLVNGAKFQGLIVEDNPLGMTFQTVKRPSGRPTLTFTTFFAKKEIDKVSKLGDGDRATLRARLAELDGNGAGERLRMNGVELVSVPWLGRVDGAKRYRADQFELLSAAPEEVTRRAAVRLEQIYTAFARFMPPRFDPDRPTSVELAGDLDQYRQLLKPRAGQVLNAAVFLPAENRILCGTDLRRLGDELHRTRLLHLQQLAATDKYEKEIRELYKGSKPDLDRFSATVKREREKVYAADRENDRTFDAATRRLFAILYHEAFHSYATTFVYPARSAVEIKAGKGTGELPRFFNEGLAQLFENPVIEAGELRIGHADPERLKRIREWLNGKGKPGDPPLLVPLADLLKAGKETFLAAHANQQASSDRTYLTCWGLAFYLLFERHLVGTAAFDDYLKSLNTGADPAKAFAELVGQDLPAFEKDWHEYLRKLQPDGSLRK